MKALYALYADPEAAQRAIDSLRASSSELKFDSGQIIIRSGEAWEGFAFTEEHATAHPYRWAVLGGVIGGVCGYLLTTLTQKAYPLPTGGMPIAPPWTNGIIVYEMTMLGAILFTLVNLLIGAGLPCFKERISEPELDKGKILVGVNDPPESSRGELEKRLRQAGASQIKLYTGNS
jgi:hypothetical protein